MVGLPVADGHLIHLQFLCHIALQQAEIKTPLSQVVAQGLQFTRIRRWQWLSGSQLEMAKGQRNPAPGATTATR